MERHCYPADDPQMTEPQPSQQRAAGGRQRPIVYYRGAVEIARNHASNGLSYAMLTQD